MIATDLFEIDGTHYLLVVDFFSRCPEIKKLSSTTSTSVINSLKGIFSTHGILEVLQSDNGPQYSSREFAVFVES